MNLIADYDATHSDVQLTADGEAAMFLFLTKEGGWVGVTLSATDLARVRDRISEILSGPTLPGEPR